MMKSIAKTHQFMTFTTPPNLQWGAATGLRLDDGYFSGLAGDMQRKRDRLARRAGRDRLRACCRRTAPIS